jgi:hypothetical protein
MIDLQCFHRQMNYFRIRRDDCVCVISVWISQRLKRDDHMSNVAAYPEIFGTLQEQDPCNQA